MPIRFITGALALLLAASPAAAWWEYGHETVARIAYEKARPDTQVAIRRLLAKGALLGTPECSVKTVELASYWADCIKPLGDRFSYAGPWHYQNVDVCGEFDLKAACKDGNCVSAQIERNARLLADRKLPERERVKALAFLLHLMGDLAQPMHAGDRDDLGGNRVSTAYGLVEGRTNLHSMWDGYIAERSISTPPGGALGMLSEYSDEQLNAMRAGTVEDWSREGWQVAKTFAYAGLMGAACGPKDDVRHRLNEEQVKALIPVVRKQVVAGGMRLAQLLDDALGPEAKAPAFRRS
jgi:hypothetical protein